MIKKNDSKKSWTKPKSEESTPSMKLKIYFKDNTIRSNCTEWTKHMKDEIAKHGNPFKKQVLKMRFDPYNETKEKKKYSLKAEIPVQEALWIAVTHDTDQAEIRAIDAGPARSAKKSELYLKWTIETLAKNAKIQEDNIINTTKLKQLPDIEKERSDTDAQLFYFILQQMEPDSRDTIESHIVLGYGKRYQPGKTVTVEAEAEGDIDGFDGVGGDDGGLGDGCWSPGRRPVYIYCKC
jgi:hypothetical protein